MTISIPNTPFKNKALNLWIANKCTDLGFIRVKMTRDRNMITAHFPDLNEQEREKAIDFIESFASIANSTEATAHPFSGV